MDGWYNLAEKSWSILAENWWYIHVRELTQADLERMTGADPVDLPAPTGDPDELMRTLLAEIDLHATPPQTLPGLDVPPTSPPSLPAPDSSSGLSRSQKRRRRRKR